MIWSSQAYKGGFPFKTIIYIYIMYVTFRTYASFENKLKSGINLNPTDYILPNEVRDIFVPDTDASN